MKSAVRCVVAQAIVLAIDVGLIEVFYRIVIPRYFDGAPTYAGLIGGLILGAVAGAYVAHKTLPEGLLLRWLWILVASAVLTSLIFLLALYVTLNTVGA